ncbi:uncharacterized protein PHALS_09201 [Plasmopara halstedii]|uniref:Uncharacterized protein n=1 Tax=Plasmopara halstedii TaxID=4781 RepID=A0A0P1AEH3_PLAHL|nr:uncharacterized protein PHALS_09201 [Plasmopara halstedii]CEG39145.1 hypothetical protein PHALS_09201 [Plasmopara halstedii]|eukprot:XP_024575514.1 hypothetical protein PHALS_09201 [Plasmopara halstedii]
MVYSGRWSLHLMTLQRPRADDDYDRLSSGSLEETSDSKMQLDGPSIKVVK